MGRRPIGNKGCAEAESGVVISRTKEEEVLLQSLVPTVCVYLMERDRRSRYCRLGCVSGGKCDQQAFPPSRHPSQDPIKRSWGKKAFWQQGATAVLMCSSFMFGVIKRDAGCILSRHVSFYFCVCVQIAI